jgi:hypothetical protein
MALPHPECRRPVGASSVVVRMRSFTDTAAALLGKPAFAGLAM